MGIQELMKEAAFKLSSELIESFEEIKGVSISGSLSQGIADEYSDIDIDIFLNDDDHKKWLRDCLLMEKYEQYKIKKEKPSNYSFIKGGFKFDINLFSIEKVEKEDWRIEQRARRQNFIFLYGDDFLKSLLNKKVLFEGEDFLNKEEEKKLSTDFYIFYINAYLNYFVPIALVRGENEQANFDIDFALMLLFEYFFIKENKFFPDTKSKWVYACKNLDSEIVDILRKIKLIKSHDTEEIVGRKKLFNELLKKINIPNIKFKHHKVNLE